MNYLQQGYQIRCQIPSDINEHLPTLSSLATECEKVIECGVAGCVSSWALAWGLFNNKSNKKILVCNDIRPCNLGQLPQIGKDCGIEIIPEWKNDLEIEGEFDMVFIDSWHVYGQLKRELAHFAPKTKKYIVMHDTTVDGVVGESVRQNHDIEKQLKETGWDRADLMIGLQPAIDQFLENNSEWELMKVYTNNNGLTILKRI